MDLPRQPHGGCPPPSFPFPVPAILPFLSEARFNDDSVSWQPSPYKIDAQAGQTLYFCSCGQTKNPPYCDGSHKGSGKTPHAFKVEKDGPIWACGCGKTKNSPFCDGSHKG